MFSFNRLICSGRLAHGPTHASPNLRRACWCALFVVAFVLPWCAPLLAAEEMRAAWVASVSNLNFPSRPGLPAATQREQIHRIVSAAADCGLNALMVQVRPESDALYDSSLEPWSRYLTGAQGKSPGYDPLQSFIEEGRARGVAIHAWINPFRAATNRAATADRHISRTMPDAVRKVGSWRWMDPGDAAVRDQVIRVCTDLLRRYPLTGIILDDYFYPYPGSGLPRGTFPDEATYGRYRAEGGSLGVAAWRRSNIDGLVQGLHRAVTATRPGAKFGVSPFGIYRPDVPAGVEARVDQFTELYADPVNWLHQGWVDYLSPQLYWPDAGPQSYSALLRWWRSPETNPRRIPIYPSIALDRLGSPFNWPVAEIGRQLELEQTIGPKAESGGFILWSIGPVLRDQKGVAKVVAAAAQNSR